MRCRYPDDRKIWVFGYTTHQQLKQGQYDWRDRTYSLIDTDLIFDLSAFWVVRQLQSHELTRAAIEPIAPLPLEQARSISDRLSNSALLAPRTSLPFSTWAGLLQHGSWRQQLAERWRGLPESQSIWQWL